MTTPPTNHTAYRVLQEHIAWLEQQIREHCTLSEQYYADYQRHVEGQEMVMAADAAQMLGQRTAEAASYATALEHLQALVKQMSAQATTLHHLMNETTHLRQVLQEHRDWLQKQITNHQHRIENRKVVIRNNLTINLYDNLVAIAEHLAKDFEAYTALCAALDNLNHLNHETPDPLASLDLTLFLLATVAGSYRDGTLEIPASTVLAALVSLRSTTEVLEHSLQEQQQDETPRLRLQERYGVEIRYRDGIDVWTASSGDAVVARGDTIERLEVALQQWHETIDRWHPTNAEAQHAAELARRWNCRVIPAAPAFGPYWQVRESDDRYIAGVANLDMLDMVLRLHRAFGCSFTYEHGYWSVRDAHGETIIQAVFLADVERLLPIAQAYDIAVIDHATLGEQYTSRWYATHEGDLVAAKGTVDELIEEIQD